MRKPHFTLTFLLLLTGFIDAYSQNKFTISGIVKDKKSGEGIFGVSVSTLERPALGTMTNENGSYSLILPEGDYNVTFFSFGYQTDTLKLSLHQDIKKDILLQEDVAVLQEIVLSTKTKDKNVTETQMSAEKFEIQELNKVPVFMGEKDLIKAIQLTPGVKAAGEGNSGFYVRGGNADQNLVLLDDALVYNPSHLLGFFSSFNSDAVKEATLYKGGMPAQFGGRLSSVLDVKTTDGDNQKFGVNGGLGLIASRLSIEGPIVKDKGSFLVAGRRTYADVFLKLSSDENIRNNKLNFYDLNLKANYQINAKNKILLSGYYGRDKLGLSELFEINWGNATGTIQWNHVFNEKLVSNTSLIFSNYDYNINLDFPSNSIKIASKIRDYTIKQEFEYLPNSSNSIKIGFNSIHHTITPGQISSDDPSSINFEKLQDRYAWENAVWINNEWKASAKLNFNYGLRFSAFSLLGEGDFYTYDQNGQVTSSQYYGSGSFVNTYFNLEPRLSARYLLDEKNSIKGSYARNTQNLHLISNSVTTSPTDLWIPSSNNVKPELSNQLAIGYYRNLQENKYEFSTEAYYKNLQNQIDFRTGANTMANDKVEGELLYGKGRAYGIEFYLKKKTGKLTGWIGYTLSRTEKQIDGINNNEWYAARQDRTHDISVVGVYELTPKWTLSAAWIYYTGSAVTFPSGKYTIDDQVYFLYTERNGYRMPDYHRLDLSATYIKKKTEKFESSWNFSLYNAYGRQNAYLIEFRQNETDPSKTEAVQTSLFRWIPAVTYNFKF